MADRRPSGRHLGVDPSDRAYLSYVVMLDWAGCIADTPVVAALVGDDIAYRADTFGADLTGLPAMAFMLQHVGAGQQALQWVRLALELIATGGKAV